MRDFFRSIVPRLCAALAVSGALCGADLEFSHELHLGKVGLTCGFCHGAAEQSTAAQDDNVPGRQLCLACHDGRTAPDVDLAPLEGRAAAERMFRFSHKQHLALGNVAPKIAEAIDTGKYLGHVPDIRAELETGNACAACHRGLAASARVDSKAHLPRMADCLVCHDKIDNPFSCEECHPPGFNLKPASHVSTFHDQHSTGKLGLDKISCQPCHGRKFTCMGCH